MVLPKKYAADTINIGSFLEILSLCLPIWNYSADEIVK